MMMSKMSLIFETNYTTSKFIYCWIDSTEWNARIVTFDFVTLTLTLTLTLTPFKGLTSLVSFLRE